MKAKEAPDRIWMACVGDVLVPGLAGFGLSCKTEKIRSEDIPYIRLDLHDKQIKALRDALEKNVQRCSCGEIGTHQYSDEDGTEYLCDEHRSDHFYEDYCGLFAPSILALAALKETP